MENSMNLLTDRV